ncbi:MAG: hypothetical protein HOV78_20145 [Hamadaea sp.]|nr:hypothetical protein [Hamadaea sp.]NUO90593.1 hypothetical protein [Dermatophilaceae bacterium]
MKFHDGDKFEVTDQTDGGFLMTRTDGRWPCRCGQIHEDEQVAVDLANHNGRLIPITAGIHADRDGSEPGTSRTDAARVARYATALDLHSFRLASTYWQRFVLRVMAVADVEQAELRQRLADSEEEVERQYREAQAAEAKVAVAGANVLTLAERAEAAEAKVARVEAECREWEASIPGQGSVEEEVEGETISRVVAGLRAALAGPAKPQATEGGA